MSGGVIVTEDREREVIETDAGITVIETPLIGPQGPPGEDGDGGGGEGGPGEDAVARAAIATETTERQEADAQEKADREAADGGIEGTIGALASIMATDSELSAAVLVEKTRAESAEGTKASKAELNAEATARDAAIAAAIAAVIDGAPGAFDTLKELAAAAESDASGIAALVTSVAGKASKGEVVTEKERAELVEGLKASKTELATEASARETGDNLKLAKASNLSDLTSPGTARSNLGLGTAAVAAASAFDAAGAAAAAQAAAEGFATTADGLLVPKTAIDTSSALGGNAASDEKLVSQKALKTAFDRLRPGRGKMKPAVALAETMDRGLCNQDFALLTSARLSVIGTVELVVGEKVSSITVNSGNTAAVEPVNQWFCLVDPFTLAVYAKTVDNTTTAWAANTLRTLAITGGYTPTEDLCVYIGVMVKATTPVSLRGTAVANSTPGSTAPMISGKSTEGLTTPASLGATAATIASNNGKYYGYVS